MRSNRSRWLTVVVGCLVLGLAIWLPTSAMARVTGQCADCHTMHNMQNGSTVFAGGPYRALTKGDCVGCHTGDNTEGNNIPYVLASAAPTYGDYGIGAGLLAGGNFYWVDAGADTKGHNVVGINGQDATIASFTPPGWSNSVDFQTNGVVAGGAASWASQLTCAGTYGCHGGHTVADEFGDISGAHHASDTTMDGSTVGKSFRFLKGILGKEDPEWEYTPTAALHNQYKGIDRTDDVVTGATGTISYLCAECHGNFHSGAGTLGADGDAAWGSPWLRHPTDLDLGSATGPEYASYPGAPGGYGAGVYSVIAPVGSVNVTATLAAVTRNDDAIVTCISCHRAHGTDYADLLRWDYLTDCNAAGASGEACGCFSCHTTKD